MSVRLTRAVAIASIAGVVGNASIARMTLPPHMVRIARPLGLAGLLCLCLGMPVLAAADPVTPYRPSVSNPAQLSAPGQLELEFGGLHTRTGSDLRDSLPYLLKLGFDPEWGVLVGGEALVSERSDDNGGQRVRGLGDTNLILKRAFLIDEATAFGVELGAKVPTARDAIGSGHADYTINGIFSRDFGKLHMDANLNATHVGLAEPGTASTQSGASASFSHPLGEQLAATAELSGLRRSGTAGTAQVLAALAYSPSKTLTMDIGLLRGLNRASPDIGLFAGLVVPLAKLW